MIYNKEGEKREYEMHILGEMCALFHLKDNQYNR